MACLRVVLMALLTFAVEKKPFELGDVTKLKVVEKSKTRGCFFVTSAFKNARQLHAVLARVYTCELLGPVQLSLLLRTGCRYVVMVALCNRADHNIFIL